MNSGFSSKKAFIINLLFIGIFFIHNISSVQATSSFGTTKKAKIEDLISLQSMIDQATTGSIITLEAGTYNGSVQINKPITIIGKPEATIMLHQDAGEGITIQSDEVKLQQLLINDKRKKPESAVITATGENLTLTELRVETAATGIAITAGQNVTLTDNRVAWNGASNAKLSERGNGIQLYHSNGGVIEGNEIEGVYDGIYTENSTELTIASNTVKGSRYAYHMMYGSSLLLESNNSVSNVTGMMIMTSERVELLHNDLTEQVANVNAQGILLYDTKQVMIRNNVISNSRVGLYIELSEHTELSNNELRNNFVGMQMLNSKQQRVVHNNFIGNVSHVWSDTVSEVEVENNYWDSFQGLDTDGDAYSNLTYRSSPFFINLIEKKPSFQLFFGTNGVQFVEQLYEHNRDEWLTDSAPSMDSYPIAKEVQQNSQSALLIVCIWLPLLAGAIQIIRWGRREEL